MTSLVKHHVQGHTIQQRREDGYINATAMCDAAGRKLSTYLRGDGTKAFLQALEAEVQICTTELIQKVIGGTPEFQGTWVHRRVAIHLAQWLSPKFAVRVTSIVEDWIEGLPRHQAFGKYLLADPSDWKKRFQDELWEEAYRIKDIPWPGMEINRQQWLAGMVNDVVYDRIGPPGFREELDNRNPRSPSGQRAFKQHQLLVEEVGVPALMAHLHAVLVLMRAADTWGVFYHSLNRSLPRAGGIAHPRLPTKKVPALDGQLSLPWGE